jgi:hypothetical protein
LKPLTLTGKFLLITKLLVLFNITLAFSSIHGDTVKPLPLVNKQFLVVGHIVYNQDTIAGIDSIGIVNQLVAASKLFSPIGVSFTLCEVRYIYNFQYDILDIKRTPELLSQNWVGQRINMFFVSDITGGLTGECGFADKGGITATQTVAVVIKTSGSCLTVPGYTIAHEFGHYFNLDHTFATANGMELVNGSNCATAGDGICDTPADPYVIGANYVDNGCTFTFTGKDTNGDYYDPDVNNIMSYYGKCICKFSKGQYEKMAKYYLSNPIEW